MSNTAFGLRDAYAGIAELWCSPQDVDLQAAGKRTVEALTRLHGSGEVGADSLVDFLAQPVSEEEYVRLFELDPKCPLYIGSHVFDEPKTCAQAAVSDRNGYMIELLGIYQHFGLTHDRTELPDYLPLMLEFLSLTTASGDSARNKLIKEYILPFLPNFRSKLEELEAPYLQLLNALEQVLALDMQRSAKPGTVPCEGSRGANHPGMSHG